jgi:glycosyltransferase involved in cell wall biosynthesis
LYIEDYAEVGGAIISLYELVRGLDRDLYEPIVLFHRRNPYRQQFTSLGVNALVIEDQGEPDALPVQRQRDIAASLSRRGKWLGDGYRIAKELYLVARRELPRSRRIGKVIKDEAIDLVHCNNGIQRVNVLAARLTGTPCICHVRALHSLSAARKYLSRYVDVFIYISQAVQERYHNMGIPPSKGTVVHNPIDINAFAGAGDRDELRVGLGLTDDDAVVSNVGRLDWWKGHDDFLKAIAVVARSHPNVKALIVGAPVSSPLGQAYWCRLRKLVTELGLGDQVVFTGFRADIPRIMAASEVVVHSASEPEPFGRVVAEAMAAGRPVVATAAGGVLEIVEDQVTGLLVPPKDAASMAKAIQWVLENAERARIIGQRAQQRARERFSIRQHVSAVERVYREVLQ